MSKHRYWLVLPNGGRQLIDPDHFDLDAMAERARRIGGKIIVEGNAAAHSIALDPSGLRPRVFEPPISALDALFRARLNRIRLCREDFTLDVNTRPTNRMLGGYYRRRKLVRIYTHDRQLGRRPSGRAVRHLFARGRAPPRIHRAGQFPGQEHASACRARCTAICSGRYWATSRRDGPRSRGHQGAEANRRFAAHASGSVIVGRCG